MKTTLTNKTTTDLDRFYQELLTDSMLQERLKAATDPESLSVLAVELGKEKGYSFTEEEVLAAMAIEAAMGSDYVEIADPLVPGVECRGCGCGRCRCGGGGY